MVLAHSCLVLEDGSCCYFAWFELWSCFLLQFFFFSRHLTCNIFEWLHKAQRLYLVFLKQDGKHIGLLEALGLRLLLPLCLGYLEFVPWFRWIFWIIGSGALLFVACNWTGLCLWGQLAGILGSQQVNLLWVDPMNVWIFLLAKSTIVGLVP